MVGTSSDCAYARDKKLESWVKDSAFLGGGGKGEPTIVTPKQCKSALGLSSPQTKTASVPPWKSPTFPQYPIDGANSVQKKHPMTTIHELLYKHLLSIIYASSRSTASRIISGVSGARAVTHLPSHCHRHQAPLRRIRD